MYRRYPPVQWVSGPKRHCVDAGAPLRHWHWQPSLRVRSRAQEDIPLKRDSIDDNIEGSRWCTPLRSSLSSHLFGPLDDPPIWLDELASEGWACNSRQTKRGNALHRFRAEARLLAIHRHFASAHCSEIRDLSGPMSIRLDTAGRGKIIDAHPLLALFPAFWRPRSIAMKVTRHDTRLEGAIYVRGKTCTLIINNTEICQ